MAVRAFYTLFSAFDIPFASIIVQCFTVLVIIPTWIRNPQYVDRCPADPFAL
jgi:hypothetical protein